MTEAYDPTTAAGRVRLLTNDVDPAAPVFTDAEIEAFLDLTGQSVFLAAAQALDTVASNEVLVGKVIRTQDLSTNGAQVSAELRARAQSLRDQAASGDDDPGAAFLVADFDPTPDYRRWRWP
ncbi:MAG: hypothetical protein J2P24_00385 [Streptosporangiales bacterium]|nr:hypothetical protein [Streptosporangiales bacterium]